MASVAPLRFRKPTLLIEAAGKRRKIVVSRLPFTIGRSADCDAAIPDFRVSRLQARLINEGGEYFIEDAGSRHGTFTNGERRDRTRLQNNDQITFGVTGLRVIFLEGTPDLGASHAHLQRMFSESVSSELEKLTLFLEAAGALSSGLLVNDVLRMMISYALRLTQAERGFVYLKQPDSSAVLACGLDRMGNSIGHDDRVSHSVVKEALVTATEFIAADATQQEALASRDSIVANELRTVIAIPLRARHGRAGSGVLETEGVLYLDSHSVSRNLAGISPDVLRALAAECALVLETARLIEAEQAAKQYCQEMEIAASIQRSLSPEAEVRGQFARVRGRTIPCRAVGGDFFDVYESPDAVTLIVADVSGKGISAALLASVIHGMFYAQVSSGAKLVDAVSTINRFLWLRVAGQKYATLLAAQLRSNGMLQIVNCGHVPPVLAAGDTSTRITDCDFPVGLLPQTSFHAIESQFPVGARLCVLTDGITECEDAEGGEFGLGRVENYLHVEDALSVILDAVQVFRSHSEIQDDCTLVILERTK
jgi:serine phosphatase RsbU (regulator of sigma subunit)